MGAIGNAPDLVELGKDGRGNDRFSSREMIETEQRLHQAADVMAGRETHAVSYADRNAAMAQAEQRGLVLSGEQADALAHVTDGRDLGIVVGFAGSGKSAMLGVARQACSLSNVGFREVSGANRTAGMAAQSGRFAQRSTTQKQKRAANHSTMLIKSPICWASSSNSTTQTSGSKRLSFSIRRSMSSAVAASALVNRRSSGLLLS